MLPTFDAGRVVKLTEDITVTLGEMVEIDLHPSGTQFDGLAVVVAAFMGSSVPSLPMVNVVSMTDPNHRVVTRTAKGLI